MTPKKTRTAAAAAKSAPAPEIPTLNSPQLYINRELSLLAFQFRVLEEAEDERNPLLERVKFLSIVGSNTDEFFMVRVAGDRRPGEAHDCGCGRGLRGSIGGEQTARMARTYEQMMTSGDFPAFLTLVAYDYID